MYSIIVCMFKIIQLHFFFILAEVFQFVRGIPTFRNGTGRDGTEQFRKMLHYYFTGRNVKNNALLDYPLN